MFELQDSLHRTFRVRSRLLILFAVIIVGAFALSAWVMTGQPKTTAQPEHKPHAGALSAAELEEQYGIRVTLIGVTAAGGMVDLRFKVLNTEKAEALLAHHESMPQLIPVGSKVRLAVQESHSPTYEDGKVYYMLFGNASGIVRPGMPVQVAFGDVLLEAVVAQ